MERTFTIEDFGKRLRELRKAQGYSQEGFALTVELDRTYIGGIERGERNPGLKTILRIAEALGVPAAELFKAR
ncbi:DNA-binding transcriptional regulator, XRE-family HTH domain [Lutimaribacter pacificus]|uniref:DNA-binding transcriptional regulator, XRE-family HTH domain n=1 Tax=Lutimaribacter pacificus TaxID=391948 RepID=A0A1H0GL32_9RHOB|nr:helix-turn-helix transcriptional regulator [Lutimaribacter pacificus]SDO07647.1 DNA-binding transcriptional regulator, XRE-family HTH domain [Lutimaribacter pacificus]SHJ89274.1 DNA-binding transcriptional regulator, XRE-family HTH domain [Lutimaribacter pacificus]